MHVHRQLLRGGYIHALYILPPKTVYEKHVIHFRTRVVQNRARIKNMNHGILLQESIKIPERTFTSTFIRTLHSLKDWRIEVYLKSIDSLNEYIGRSDFKINDNG